MLANAVISKKYLGYSCVLFNWIHIQTQANIHSNLTLPFAPEQLGMVYPINYKLSWGNLATSCFLSHTTLSSGKTRKYDRVRLSGKTINMSFQELQNILAKNILTTIRNFLLCKHWGFLGAIIYSNSGVSSNILRDLRVFFFNNSVMFHTLFCMKFYVMWY